MKRIMQGQYYPDYAYEHALFTPDMKIYTDSKVSDFLHGLKPEQSVGFLNSWNKSKNKRQKIYLSYDSTNKNCQAGDIDLVEYGNAKKQMAGCPFLITQLPVILRTGPLFLRTVSRQSE